LKNETLEFMLQLEVELAMPFFIIFCLYTYNLNWQQRMALK